MRPQTIDTWTLEDLQAQIAWQLKTTPSAANAPVLCVSKGGAEYPLRGITYAHGEVQLLIARDINDVAQRQREADFKEREAPRL